MAKHRRKTRKSVREKRARPKEEYQDDVYTSEIRSYSGTRGGSFAAGVCFTLVFQTRDRNGKMRNVVWHVLPRHVDKYLSEAGERLEEEMGFPFASHNMFKKGSTEWKTHRGLILQKLSEGELIQKHESRSIHPVDVLDSIVEHLRGVRRGGARIRVTIIPGNGTLSNPADKRALMKMKASLGQMKNKGKIHNLRTRGLSDEAGLRGASEVDVRPGGRIYRVK